MKLTVLSAFMFALAGNVAVATAADSDDRIEDVVSTKLSHDGRLRGQKIKVDIDNGVAKLEGKVASQADKARAEHVAAACAGVVRVQNDLEVDVGVAKDRVEDNADKTKDAIDDNAKRTKDRVEENADRAKERVDERAKVQKENLEHKGTNAERDRNVDRAPVEHHGDSAPVSDSWVTGKVKTQMLGVEALKGSDIQVGTDHDGVVTLRGTVPSEAARARAVAIARTTKGVRRVVDELKLERR